jgi:hypothetical protein
MAESESYATEGLELLDVGVAIFDKGIGHFTPCGVIRTICAARG